MFDAVILAGGAARRLDGADKPALDIGGRSLLARVLDAVADAQRVVIAGPQRDLGPGGPVRLRAPVWCREEPPGGGPVAGLAAALPHTTAATIVVLAADLPWIAGAREPLLAALPPEGAALLVDAAGRINHLAGAWRRTTLVAALRAVAEPAGASMRALLSGVPLVEVPDQGGWGADCDTWADVEAARRRTTLRT